MSEKTNSGQYYQFRPELGHQIFIKLEDQEVENLLLEDLSRIGFEKIDHDDVKAIPYTPGKTTLLHIRPAGLKTSKQIKNFNGGMAKYGHESLTHHGAYQTYHLRDTALMVFSPENPKWELGILLDNNKHEEYRLILNRFLSWTLAKENILGLWAVPVDEGIVVMKPVEAHYESCYVDLERGLLYTFDGIREIDDSFQILKLDSDLKDNVIKMKKEELVAFLSSKLTYFSYSGPTFGLKNSLFQLTKMADGIIYPRDHFKPRSDALNPNS